MIALLEEILRTAAQISSHCGPLGIAAFGIIAVVVILGFVLHWGIKDAPSFLRIIVGVGIVVGLLFILGKGMISPGRQSEGSVPPARIQTPSYRGTAIDRAVQRDVSLPITGGNDDDDSN